MSELTLAQAKYKALVPDLTGVATNAVTDKSVGVAFSGLVTHSALNNAAKVIADRIEAELTGRTRAASRSSWSHRRPTCSPVICCRLR